MRRLIIEQATEQGEVVGWRLHADDRRLLVFARTPGMEGFRIGEDFVPGFGKTIDYDAVFDSGEGEQAGQEPEETPFYSPIHEWFELSYASFLTVPRLVMDSMPLAWQRKMVALLEEMDATFDWRPKGGRYWVRLRDEDGRFSDAPLGNYRRGSVEHLRRTVAAEEV